jgi:nucleoside-diphosphate-sugar epimerase
LVQALGDVAVGVPLWVLTCGAVAAGDVLVDPVQAQVWGLGRVAALEHPGRWGGLVDLPALPDEPAVTGAASVLDDRAAGRLCGVLAGISGENEVAIRPSGILARRLVRVTQDRDHERDSWRPSGTVLVTGGTGAIGSHVARWLAGRGVSRLILASRSGPAAAGAAGVAAAVAGSGSAVTVVAADVADRGTTGALLGWADHGGPPLRGVFHMAGVLDDGVLDRLDEARLAGVLGPKAGGAAVLDELTAGRGLDAFVLFSSAAATFGSAGQGNYAAANAYLDALAERRRARGLAGTSIAWGTWAGAGLARSSATVRARIDRGALPAMDPVLAVGALGQAIEGLYASVAVMDVDWEKFTAGGGAVVPLLRDLPDVADLAGSEAPAGPGPSGLAAELAGRTAGDQGQVLLDLVRSRAAAVLGHPGPGAISPGRAFTDLGLDSLTALELAQQLTAITGLPLPATTAFDYPTPNELAQELQAGLIGTMPAQEPVFTELDQLEAILSGITPNDGVRGDVTKRLQAVLSKWLGAESNPRATGVSERLQSATADEVVDFINKELGVS